MLLGFALGVLVPWLESRERVVPFAAGLFWGSFATGVLLVIAERIRQFRRGWLPKPDKAAERALAWRIGLPGGLFLSGAIRFFQLYWAWFVMGGLFAGLCLALILKPDLPEREGRGR